MFNEHIICFILGKPPISETDAREIRGQLHPQGRYIIEAGETWRSYCANPPANHVMLGSITERQLEDEAGALGIDLDSGRYVQITAALIAPLDQQAVHHALAGLRFEMTQAQLVSELTRAEMLLKSAETCEPYWHGRQAGLTRRYCANYFCPVSQHSDYLAAERCADSQHRAFGCGYREGLLLFPEQDNLCPIGRFAEAARVQCQAHWLIESITR